jgi:hypothetical protein
LKLPAFFLLDLDFLPFGGCSLSRPLEKTLRLLRAARANLLTTLSEIDYPRTSYWLISLGVNREEITVDGLPLQKRRWHATRLPTTPWIQLTYKAAVGLEKRISQEWLIDLASGPFITRITGGMHHERRPQARRECMLRFLFTSEDGSDAVGTDFGQFRHGLMVAALLADRGDTVRHQGLAADRVLGPQRPTAQHITRRVPCGDAPNPWVSTA